MLNRASATGPFVLRMSTEMFKVLRDCPSRDLQCFEHFLLETLQIEIMSACLSSLMLCCNHLAALYQEEHATNEMINTCNALKRDHSVTHQATFEIYNDSTSRIS